jgi:regulator of sirC expression with transglutaminase-like and TPR domain
VPPTPHPFDQIITQPEDQIRLAAAALWYAADEYPDVKVAYYLEFLDALATRVARHKAATPHEQIDALRLEIVEHEGFAGNRTDYHNPQNSYLNRVIDRRTGIPVSLSAIWLDVAARLGWPFAGLNMPGHFLICATGSGEDIIVDPFNDGAVLSKAECGHMALALFGSDFRLQPEHLAHVGTRDVLRRMLGNLHSIYLVRRDWPRCTSVLRRMFALRPTDHEIAAELAQLLAVAGELAEALAILHGLLNTELPDDRRQFIHRQIDILHHRIAQTN